MQERTVLSGMDLKAYLGRLKQNPKYEQIDNEVNLSAFHCYLCSGKNMGDVSKLPAGSYLMVDCGETMRKVREQLKDGQKEQRRTEHR